MFALLPNSPPPPNYYADNLRRLLRAVVAQYSDLLNARERDYVDRISALSIDAQRLYARLLTRKGPLVRIASLDYREVERGDAALDELECAALVHRDPSTPADLALAMLTRAELAALFPHMRSRGLRKNAAVVAVAARYPDRRILETIARTHPMCAVLDLDVLATMQILFFGIGRGELTTFVLEDLGMLRFEAYALDPARRQFLDRAELDDYLHLRTVAAELHGLQQCWRRETAETILDALWNARGRRAIERVRGRLANQLGRCAERARDYELALSAYARGARAPARERRVRLLYRLGDEVGAGRLLAAIDRDPVSAGEHFFATQFRKRHRRQHISERTLRLPQAPTARVEAAALAALTCDGGSGRHLENRMPLGMLGLAFWDVVFAPVDAAFVNPYQRGPADLYWEDFRRSRSALIASRLKALAAPGGLRARALATAAEKCGVTNALIDWSAFDATWIDAASRVVPSAVWIAMFDFMLDDLEQSRTGFPDLTVLHDGGYQFVEVKGPGDQLRREQRLWFAFFARHDVAASVVRVEW